MPVLSAKVKQFSPMRTIVLSFLMVIFTGTALLILPISSKSGELTPFVNSLFTATSATCVTGLIVYDTYTQWSWFGQGVILAMIQIGGLGLVTFTSFFNFAIGRKLGLRSMQLASESVNSGGFSDVRGMVHNIVKISLIAEGSGALILMLVFVPKYQLEGIWISVFLAVSAFCNAGFDLLGREGAFVSLTNYADNPIVIVTIMLLITMGGLGFVVWADLLAFRKTKRLVLHTKIVLLVTGILIVFGAVIFLITEWNNTKTIGGLSFIQKFDRTLFHSVTLRTAGFNTIEAGDLTPFSKILSIMIMFIGAAPGSTGGGIKVTTFAVLIMTVVCVMRNAPETQIMGRKIDKDIVYKSMSITVLAAVAVMITSCILVFTNETGLISGIDSVFESVSAFATVGISAGPTAVSNNVSRCVMAFTMFLGRVGPVSLALSLALGMEARGKHQIMPEGKVFVG